VQHRPRTDTHTRLIQRMSHRPYPFSQQRWTTSYPQLCRVDELGQCLLPPRLARASSSNEMTTAEFPLLVPFVGIDYAIPIRCQCISFPPPFLCATASTAMTHSHIGHRFDVRPTGRNAYTLTDTPPTSPSHQYERTRTNAPASSTPSTTALPGLCHPRAYVPRR
jgi:hypothetical protein